MAVPFPAWYLWQHIPTLDPYCDLSMTGTFPSTRLVSVIYLMSPTEAKPLAQPFLLRLSDVANKQSPVIPQTNGLPENTDVTDGIAKLTPG